MIPLIEGSSKQFFFHSPTTLLMTFKDDIHGAGRSDAINGTGSLRKQFSYYFYKYLEKQGILTHLDETHENPLQEEGIIVKKCTPVKLEVLVRNVARGHWVDQHKIPLIEGGTPFQNPVVEFCIKIKTILANGNIIDDPRVNEDLIVELHSLAKDSEIRGHLLPTVQSIQKLKEMALTINYHYQKFLQLNGWILEDFKFEVGIVKENSEYSLILIDEISPDCSRIRDTKGQSLTKDLFRQQRSHEEIYESYAKLASAIQNASNN